MRDPRQPVHTDSGDGAIRIELDPLGPETRACIETPAGIFSGRNYRLRITDLEAHADTDADADVGTNTGTGPNTAIPAP